MRFLSPGVLAAVCLLTTACGSSTAVPTLAPPTAAATPASAASTQTNAAGSALTLVIDGSNSHASYHAHEQLVGRNLPSEAVGTSSGVSGTIVFNSDGSIDASQSQIKVDLRQLTSDESRRDNFIKGSTLQINQFPMATFTPREAQGLPSPLPTSGSATFQLVGDLT